MLFFSCCFFFAQNEASLRADGTGDLEGPETMARFGYVVLGVGVVTAAVAGVVMAVGD